jgi:hypothetical protein
MNPSTLGFIRALGVAVVMAIVSYLADVPHLNGVVSTSAAVIISAIALAIEHSIASSTGKALFGAVRTQK